MDEDYFHYLMITQEANESDRESVGCSGCLTTAVIGILLLLFFI